MNKTFSGYKTGTNRNRDRIMKHFVFHATEFFMGVVSMSHLNIMQTGTTVNRYRMSQPFSSAQLQFWVELEVIEYSK